MAADLVLLSEQEGIATVTVNRPDKLNALNGDVIGQLTAAFERCRDAASTGAVILTGAGEKAFVAGADISVLSSLDPRTARDTAHRGQRLTVLMETLGKPVIAAINGYAFGGGLELAMACTIRVAAEGSKVGQPEVKLGLLAGYGGTQRLPRLVGKGRALELLLTGEPIDAAEAHRIGLVNRVVKRESLLDECRALARKILAAGPVGVRYTIEAVNRGLDVPLAEGLRIEADLFGQIAGTADMKEGTTAFLEKRPAKFTGQ
ncbi:MAG: enoyl-CoA hydratase/isomerase family protein [Planctomycetaceae bacterium]|nr:enoyl-CoA hydratase/isomerase family protein [Planctomycetaceae bacterium]